MIKNKANIIYYTKNISLNEATKIVLNKYYTLNPLNTFEYIFINFQKKVEFQYLIDDNNNTNDIDEIDDIFDIDDIFAINDTDDIYKNNKNKETVKELKKHNEISGSILNIKKKKKHNKNDLFNIYKNEIIEVDNGK